MNSESLRIADQLRRAFSGKPWHGDPLFHFLTRLTEEQAQARPLPVHSIWELVVHIELWVRIALEATDGIPMPKLYGTEKDWSVADGGNATKWAAVTERLYQSAEGLARAIEGFSDARLKEIVPGREYDFYYLFHGIVQHSLYHAGQIALLKKAIIS